MIVARGLGRSARGASGIIVAAGLGIVLIRGGGGEAFIPRHAVAQDDERGIAVRILDDADLLDIVPIIVEVINGRR